MIAKMKSKYLPRLLTVMTRVLLCIFDIFFHTMCNLQIMHHEKFIAAKIGKMQVIRKNIKNIQRRTNYQIFVQFYTFMHTTKKVESKWFVSSIKCHNKFNLNVPYISIYYWVGN